MPSKFSRLRIGLDLIQMDLRNARDRQRERIRRNGMQALNIQDLWWSANQDLRSLRRIFNKIEKLEAKEKETKKKRNNSGGQNINLGGTYGKI